MNMHVKQYASEQEIVASYSAVRQRLMNPPRSKPDPKQPAKVIVLDLPPARCKMPKDAHVEAFRLWQWREAQKATSVAYYLRTRCREMDISYKKLMTSKLRPIVRNRQLLIWEVKQRFKLSMPMIAKHFGGIDHTTVLHAIRKIEELKAAGEIE
ncbi:helix-turn-helix domain-containing protein [Rhizobium mongolense]